MHCICSHNKMKHTTWDCYGEYGEGCTVRNCQCEEFYPKRDFEINFKNGYIHTSEQMDYYKKNYGNAKLQEVK